MSSRSSKNIMAKSEMGFRPHGLHLKAYAALAVCIFLVVALVVGFVVDGFGAFELVAGCLVIVGAGLFMLSAAYGIWGRLHILVDEDDWCVITWRLGRFVRTKRFPRPDVRRVRVRVVDAGDGAFGGSADKVLEVDIQREVRPLRLGRGFYLEEEEMQAIANAFGCELLPLETE